MSVRPINFLPNGDIDKLDLDVSPGLPSDNHLNGFVAYPKFTTKTAHSCPIRVETQHLLHFRFVKFGASTVHTSCIPSFDDHIGMIVL